MKRVFPILVTATFLAACGGGSGGGETPTAATPVFTPGAGTYTTVQAVAISTTTPGASIYYTTDGSSPTTGSTLYGTAVTVATSATLKAIATAPGFTTSAVGSASYTINLPGFATFCAQLQSSLVALEVDCWKTNPDVIALEGSMCDDLAIEIQAGRIVYDPTHAADCQAALAGAGCGGRSGEPAACRLALVGQQANGSTCYDGAACPNGFCNSMAGACPGLCRPVSLAGQGCMQEDECADGLVCEGYYYGPGVCRVPSGPGGYCPCLAGLYCDYNTARCATHKTLGGSCIPYASDECAPGLTCIGSPNPTCQPLVGPGGACADPAYGSQCGRGYSCISGVCVADPKVGEPCTTYPSYQNCIGGYCDATTLKCVASTSGGTCSAAPDLPGLTLYDAFMGTTLDGTRWQNGAFSRGVSGGAAVLSVDVTNMKARSIRNDQYTSMVNVPSGATNRVTTLQADVTVPAATASRTGGVLIRAGVRLLYSPPLQRLLFPGALQDMLNIEVGLVDDGTGLKAFRQFIHCDDASCATFTATGIAFLDPPSFTDIVTGMRGAAAAYDISYTMTLRLDETTMAFHWTITGGVFGTSGVSGTADPAAYLAANAGWTPASPALPVPLDGEGYLGAQIGARAADFGAGGGAARFTGRFDNVQVGRNNGAPAAYDDFSGTGTNSGPDDLSPARWGTPGTTTVGPSGGSLVVHHHVSSAISPASGNAIGGTASIGMAIGDPVTVNAMQVDVAFENYATTGTTASGSAVLVGRFFNDGTGTRAGEGTGDVQGSVDVQANPPGSASWNIYRCSNPNCSTLTRVGSGLLPGSGYNVGGHRLLLKWNPTTTLLTFGADGNTVTVNPTISGAGGVATPVTSVGPAFSPVRSINLSASLNTNTLGTYTNLDFRISDVLIGP